ncbi:hypothetical protein LTR53_012218 [Teratosphaeriaceae sp. CCFEE 6253]|nr:hypothetical protein LTR53_012218 [Teratosphaeriaceae sp. CCFEE 6253]
MAWKLRRPSIPGMLSERHMHSSRGAVQETSAEKQSIHGWGNESKSDSDDLRLPHNNASYDLAKFLRTTGPREPCPSKSPKGVCGRSKSLPRQLLEYWRPRTSDGEQVSPSPDPRSTYTYQERLRAWVREASIDQCSTLPPLPLLPSRLPSRLPDSVVQKTTSAGSKHLELKVPRSPNVDDASGRVEEKIGHPPKVHNQGDLDRLFLRDMTSDELLDGWLADFTIGTDLESERAQDTDALSRISSIADGHLSTTLPPAWSRDSVNTVVRTSDMGALRSPIEFLDMEDGDLQESDYSAHRDGLTTPTEVNDGLSGVPVYPGSALKSGIGKGSFNNDHTPKSCSPPQSLAAHTSGHPFASSDLALGMAVNERIRKYERGSFNHGRSKDGDRLCPVSNTHLDNAFGPARSGAHGLRASTVLSSNQVPVQKIRLRASDMALRPRDSGTAPWQTSDGTLALAEGSFMEDAKGRGSHHEPELARSTRNALLYSTTPAYDPYTPERKLAARSEISRTRSDERPDAEERASISPTGPKQSTDQGAVRSEPMAWMRSEQTWLDSDPDPSSSRTSSVSPKQVQRAAPAKGLRQAQSEEQLGSQRSRAYTKTKPLPPLAGSPHCYGYGAKLPHISTLSRFASAPSAEMVRGTTYMNAPTPPPDKALPPLPVPNTPEHPGLRAGRPRIALLPLRADKVASKAFPERPHSRLSPQDLRALIQQSLQQHVDDGVPGVGIQEALRTADKADKKVAALELIEAQVYELQFKASQLSAMVVEVLHTRY